MKKALLIDNKKSYCDHGFLNPMKARKGKYIPDNLCNHMKEIVIKYCSMKRALRLHSSYDDPKLNYHDI